MGHFVFVFFQREPNKNGISGGPKFLGMNIRDEKSGDENSGDETSAILSQHSWSQTLQFGSNSYFRYSFGSNSDIAVLGQIPI